MTGASSSTTGRSTTNSKSTWNLCTVCSWSKESKTAKPGCCGKNTTCGWAAWFLLLLVRLPLLGCITFRGPGVRQPLAAGGVARDSKTLNFITALGFAFRPWQRTANTARNAVLVVFLLFMAILAVGSPVDATIPRKCLSAVEGFLFWPANKIDSLTASRFSTPTDFTISPNCSTSCLRNSSCAFCTTLDRTSFDCIRHIAPPIDASTASAWSLNPAFDRETRCTILTSLQNTKPRWRIIPLLPDAAGGTFGPASSCAWRMITWSEWLTEPRGLLCALRRSIDAWLIFDRAIYGVFLASFTLVLAMLKHVAALTEQVLVTLCAVLGAGVLFTFARNHIQSDADFENKTIDTAAETADSTDAILRAEPDTVDDDEDALWNTFAGNVTIAFCRASGSDAVIGTSRCFPEIATAANVALLSPILRPSGLVPARIKPFVDILVNHGAVTAFILLPMLFGFSTGPTPELGTSPLGATPLLYIKCVAARASLSMTRSLVLLTVACRGLRFQNYRCYVRTDGQHIKYCAGTFLWARIHELVTRSNVSVKTLWAFVEIVTYHIATETADGQHPMQEGGTTWITRACTEFARASEATLTHVMASLSTHSPVYTIPSGRSTTICERFNLRLGEASADFLGMYSQDGCANLKCIHRHLCIVCAGDHCASVCAVAGLPRTLRKLSARIPKPRTSTSLVPTRAGQ